MVTAKQETLEIGDKEHKISAIICGAGTIFFDTGDSGLTPWFKSRVKNLSKIWMILDPQNQNLRTWGVLYWFEDEEMKRLVGKKMTVLELTADQKLDAYLHCCQELGTNPGEVLVIDTKAEFILSAIERGFVGLMYLENPKFRPENNDVPYVQAINEIKVKSR